MYSRNTFLTRQSIIGGVLINELVAARYLIKFF